MSVFKVAVNGVEYAVAPFDPELHEHPSPAYPVAVTPEVAKSWLGYNWRNRGQRAKGLSDYTADMSDGNFDLNGATITFSRPLKQGEDPDIPVGKPVLIDGQHRLESCVRSGRPFVTYVAYGLDPRARDTVDGGIKRRLQDVFQMNGEVNAATLASVTTRCYAWNLGDKHLTLKRSGMTKAALEKFLHEHPEMRRCAEIANRLTAEFIGSGIRQSVAGVAYWLFTQADPTSCPEFFARLGHARAERAEGAWHHLPFLIAKNTATGERWVRLRGSWYPSKEHKAA